MEVLASVLEIFGCMMSNMQDTVEDLQIKYMRLSLVIMGLKTGNERKSWMEDILSFVEEALGVEVFIVDSFKLGVGLDKPIVITVESIEKKLEIFQAIDKFRNAKKKNKQKCTIFATDYLPPRAREKKRKEREIYKKNETDEATKEAMTWGRNGLTIEGKPYQKLISPPDAIKMLAADPKEIDSVFDTKIMDCKPEELDNNTCLAHAIYMDSVAEIQKAYMKLRLMYPQANYIACAYIMPGILRYLFEDHEDDGGTGVGRSMLNIMRSNKIVNTAIFLVHIQGGASVGGAKFDIIAQVVARVINQNQYNNICNKSLSIMLNEKAGKNSARGKNIRGRGGGTKYSHGASNHRESPKAGASHGGAQKRRRQDEELEYQFVFSEPAHRPPWQLDVDATPSLGSSWPSLPQK